MADSAHPYDDLTPDTLLDAIESAGYVANGRIFPLNSYENRVYQVGIEDDSPLIAKFYRPTRWTREQIEEEHTFSHELEAAEIPVIAPTVMPNGTSLGEHAGFLFAVFAQRGGQAPDTSETDMLWRLGQWLGQMHNIGARQPFRHRPAFDLIGGLVRESDYLTRNGWIPEDLRPAWDSLIPDLIEHCRQRIDDAGPIETVRLHGDCHGGNILVREERMLFVDLDDCRQGPAIQDLWLLLNGDDTERSQQFTELLEGYETFRDFNRRERYLIEPLRCFRQMTHAAWLARRWDDPAFPRFFPWFARQRFWSDLLLSLREQLGALQAPPINVIGQF
ncbi:Ser/Thr protein kinase RdoA (MazF antagonist) [Tamilnaduibacter salinus]|uniref:Stress response kinase A n=1 Tax=Tamilnaduibacter salinus TaxID=1484056 RepID=A0A2U1CUF1_9GAMM|nr:serine/threonine protein kinase [Tamilnaduibacter salinus]PVY70712.1 Ser/Thr protein kinase RdoA (MazF antagonist) [Tamilnaduibacter salinus]